MKKKTIKNKSIVKRLKAQGLNLADIAIRTNNPINELFDLMPEPDKKRFRRQCAEAGIV